MSTIHVRMMNKRMPFVVQLWQVAAGKMGRVRRRQPVMKAKYPVVPVTPLGVVGKAKRAEVKDNVVKEMSAVMDRFHPERDLLHMFRLRRIIRIRTIAGNGKLKHLRRIITVVRKDKNYRH